MAEYTPNETRVLLLLRRQGFMRANTTAANLTALQSLRDKGAAVWSEKDRKWLLVKQDAVSEVLAKLVALTDDELDMFFGALDHGMHDEWDCTLATALDQFGPAEWRIAIKSAFSLAKYQEKRQ